ncbi:hypothetical protein LLH03_18670 [bacterium]|nr:hypothetical protein [bacterium]
MSRRGLESRRLCQTLPGLVLGVALLGGCSHFAQTPPTVLHVEADNLDAKYPECLQSREAEPPKAFLVKSEAAWKKVWGAAEPPVINFDKSMIFVAHGSIGSEGPGTLTVYVLKFVEREDVMEVRVKESLSGEWPLSSGFSRAYEIVKLPRTDKPVKVLWRYLWGSRDQTHELKASEWTPPAPTRR